MTRIKFITGVGAAGLLAMLTSSVPPSAAVQAQQASSPASISAVISGAGRARPKLAVPSFIPLSDDPDVVKVARTMGDVLWDDFAFEKEFYLLPKDILRTVPRPASLDQVSLARWKELGADGVVAGTVAKVAGDVVVEVRLIRVSDGTATSGKNYSVTARAIADGGRTYAHAFADDVHRTQRNLRGVARTKLAFSSDRDGGRMTGPMGERAIANIYQSDYDGANQVRLTVTRSLDIAPTWSPDMSTIAYQSYRAGYPDIILQSLRDVRVPATPARGDTQSHNFLPAWSPDGSKLAFMSNRDGNTEIYVVNRDGSGLRRITNHPENDATPTWSPTGTQLAFTSNRSGTPQIYVVNVDGTGLVRITEGNHSDRPTWSPAPLNEIAYTSLGPGGADVRIYDFRTRRARTVTDGIGSNGQPSFAPNGRHLAFVSDRTGLNQVYTIARDGTGLRQITSVGVNRYPGWSQ